MRLRIFLCWRYVADDWLVHKFFQKGFARLGGHDRPIIQQATKVYNALRPCTVVMDDAREERKARHPPA